jgi:DNA mismatch repair protein MutS
MPSPMMTQFYELKQAYPNDILFFRLGDFYEMFAEDAKLAASILDLVLTARKNTIDGNIPMCGVPYHSSNQYIQKLIKAGYSVALCEQQGSAKDSKGLVTRKVVKVITPGTALLDIEATESRYIASVYTHKNNIYLALADLGTGLFEVGKFMESELKDVLQSKQVKEIILSENSELFEKLQKLNIRIVAESKWSFQLERALEVLTKHFNVSSMTGFGFEVDDMRLSPAGALLGYLIYTQQEDLKHITRLKPISLSQYMRLDTQSIQNLELFQLPRASQKGKTFYQAINYTKNPLGARMLRSWILSPLLDVKAIQARQEHIQNYIDTPTKITETRDLLAQIADIERVLARLSSNVGGPRDMLLLSKSFEYIAGILKLDIANYTKLAQKALLKLEPLKVQLQKALRDNVPILARDGGFVAKGYRDDIDELLNLSQGGKEWLLELQSQEQARTGINSLKVKYNKVFGYYIEISNAYKNQVLPDNYIKKQTLANAERYITPELKEFEEKILSSEAELLGLEQIVFEELRQAIIAESEQIYTISQTIAYIDCIQSGAKLAIDWNYNRPKIIKNQNLYIEAGRHPVLEQLITEYIPNDCKLAEPDHSLMLITGPNMGGKSTYIRQVALIVLLAQMGYFVPANSAKIGVADRIFTRVGASDNMSEGQSTFMVEMLEVANILHNASKSSLIILDEVGRGTSTYDGMSIAKALIEYIHNTIQARTLFATHYHELLSLEGDFEGVVNYQVIIQESNESILFLHRIEQGGADKSYGIAIAKLAGFPADVLELAKRALIQYEQKKSQLSFLEIPIIANSNNLKQEVNPHIKQYQQLLQDIHSNNLNDLTPMQALAILDELQKNNPL